MTDWFAGEVAARYDKSTAGMPVEPVVDFLAPLAGGGALELAIGTGRIAVPLAERGVRVAGIDLSPDMVAELRKKTDEIPVAIGDMSTTKVDGTFSLVYVVFNSINNVTTQDGQVATFRERRRAPRAGRLLRRRGRRAEHAATRGLRPERHARRRRRARLRHPTPRLAPLLLVDGEWRRHLDAVPLGLAGGARPDGAARRTELRERWADWDRSPFTAESTKHISVWEKTLKIELPIESERLVIRPLELADAADLGEPAEWIQEKIDRFERDGGMSLWAAVERESGRTVAMAGLQWEQIDGRRELDLGCVVAGDAQQRGYGTEASVAILRRRLRGRLRARSRR